MYKLFCIAVAALVLSDLTSAWLRKGYPSTSSANAFLDNDYFANVASPLPSPLFLTPYIEAGKLDEGRKLSAVKGLPGGAPTIASYSGFLTVNKTYNSNLFFWFFPPLTGKVDHNTPVLLWLQGGPGATSLYGLFTENGPLVVTKENTVHLRNETWNSEFAIVFIDQPVGTGFSFTSSNSGYARNENDVARDLYEALKQFFTLYQDYRGNPFFVTGESYAGKYIPAIAHKIHQMGEEAKKAGINLQGLSIGDGWSDPQNMFDYGDYLYQVGLIDEPQRDHFIVEQNKFKKAVAEKEFIKAFNIMDALMDGDLTPGGLSYYKNVTGMSNYFNILFDNSPENQGYFNKYLALPETRSAIHVGNLTFNDGNTVEEYLRKDVVDTVKPWVEEILNANYRTLMYSGQLDVIVAAPLTENFLRNLNWSKSRQYQQSKRKIYKVKPEDKAVAGYVRQADNFIYVLIRNSGHMVPYDQPRVAKDMITRFVKKQNF